MVTHAINVKINRSQTSMKEKNNLISDPSLWKSLLSPPWIVIIYIQISKYDS